MVLGILSVMVIMAVAFAVSMRTERVAAGNYADSVRARQLVQVGLARAMADIQNNLCLPDRMVVGRDGNPKITVMGGGKWEVSDWAVFESPGTLPAPIVASQLYQISYSETNDVRLAGVTLTTDGILPDNIMPSEGCLFDAVTLSFKVSGIRLYYRGTPVYFTGSGNDNTYYVIPIDQTHIKLANSYENALQGTALTPLVLEPLNLKPIHYIIPIHTIASKSSAPINTITLDKTCKFKTGDAVTYYDPPAPYTTDGTVYYVRVVETNVIQLADSYNKAILGDCLNVAVFEVNGYLKKRGFLAPPWPGYASYTTNTLQSIVAKYELVTFDTVLSEVIVSNRYHSGDCITFTKTNALMALPSPLKEKEPYYVIGISANRIKLATTIDNALASPPTSIALSGGSGSPRLYLTILSGEVTNYIPMSLYAGVSTAACEAVTNTYVDVTSAVSANESILLGKYRYLVADCSGLLDANFIGSSTMERRFGINTEEIAIENLPEIGARKPAFLFNRTANIRYETIHELAALDVRPTNLFVYSYSPAEKWNTDMLNYFAPVNLAGDAATLIGRYEAIANAFYLAGIKEEDYRECLYRSLIDYVDLDNIPNNLNVPAAGNLILPSNEKIPMINEIKIYHKLQTLYDGTALTRQFKYDGDITFEIWWPFVDRPEDDDFTFVCTIDCVPPLLGPASTVVLADFTTPLWDGTTPVTEVPVTDPDLKFKSEGPFIYLSKKATIPHAETALLDATTKNIDYIQLNNFTIQAQVKNKNGDVVDAIDGTFQQSFRLAPIDGQIIEDVRDLECLDPRYNYYIGDYKYWRYIVQSFVNQASSTELTLSEYTAGWSFDVNDPVVFFGGSLPSPLVAGKIYRIASKTGGRIEIKENPAGSPITFVGASYGGNYIKAVLDKYDSLSGYKKLNTARAYPQGTTIKVSDDSLDLEYQIASYDPKIRKITTTPDTPSAAAYIRDKTDTSSESLGRVNDWTLSYLDGQTRDGDPYMCVENAPLKSVAELGRLIYSYHPTVPAKIELWTNLTFYGVNTNQLLDVFAIGDDNGVNDFVTTAKRGLLNPNASNANCLATVLSGACVDDFNDLTVSNKCSIAGDTVTLLDDSPNNPLDRYYFTGMPVTLNNALYYVYYVDYNHLKLATTYENAINGILINPLPIAGDNYILPAKLTKPMAEIMARKMAGGSSTNYSQLARTLSDFNFGADSEFPYPATELEKESLIGHNIGLLSLRQNLFTIIIEAQVASGGNIPLNPVRQRAVALVWRDPYTGEMFVRSIKWLKD